MRKLFTIFFATLALCAVARQITPEEAAAVASEFLNTRLSSRPVAGRVAVSSVKAKSTSDNDSPRPFYVFNADDGRGFVIVSGDDSVHKILGYSTAGRFDFDNLPPAFEYMLGQYEKEIEAISSVPATPLKSENTASVARPAIEPLITTKWGQSAPYNLQCPVLSDVQAPTGCVATAFAQVMNYHKWPQRGLGSHSYEFEGNTYSIDFSEIEFDWNAMLDEYSDESEECSRNAVATLMKACGYSVDMMYGVTESSAFPSDIVKAACEYFDYSAQAYYSERSDFTQEQWESIIYSQLSNGLPVIYSGHNENSYGHCFVCDGYDGEGYFHFNWGWNGWDDGYFLLSSSPEAVNGFSYGQGCIVNFYPSNKENAYLSDGTFVYQEIDPGKVILTGLADPSRKLSGEVVLPDETVIDGVTYQVTAILRLLGDIIDIENVIELEIRTHLLSIPAETFAYATKLESITFPSTILSIGSGAFRECKSLTGSITIPSSVVSIGACAFIGCSGLKGSLILPNGITEIGDDAFRGCSGFTGSLILPNSLVSIGRCAFEGCSGFNGSLALPDVITSINSFAFSECSGLTGELIIPNTVTSIGAAAFQGCSGFTGSLSLPESLTSIGEFAFSVCRGFIGQLEIPSAIISIENYAFYGCSGFTGALTLPVALTSIGEYAFLGCKGITEIDVPETVQNIGEYAFLLCDGLVSLKLHKSLKTIGVGAFEGCDNIKNVFYDTEVPITADAGIFEQSVYDGATLYVPAGSVENAKHTAPWQKFAHIVERDFNRIYVEEIELGVIDHEMFVGDKYQFMVDILPLNADDKSLVWSSSCEDVVKVDAEGRLTALSVGEVMVTATAADGSGVSASCNVTVMPVLAEELTVDPESWAGLEGESFMIVASVLPENTTDKSIGWSSSDQEVAVVDDYGNVTVLKEGSCVIEARTLDGSGLSAECVITGRLGVEAVFADYAGKVDVYTPAGTAVLLRCSREDLSHLTPGLYLIRFGSKAKTVYIGH